MKMYYFALLFGIVDVFILCNIIEGTIKFCSSQGIHLKTDEQM